MSEVKIPEGYKQTEIGIIPEDWNFDLIKNVLKITTGNKIPKIKLKMENILFSFALKL